MVDLNLHKKEEELWNRVYEACRDKNWYLFNRAYWAMQNFRKKCDEQGQTLPVIQA